MSGNFHTQTDNKVLFVEKKESSICNNVSKELYMNKRDSKIFFMHIQRSASFPANTGV